MAYDSRIWDKDLPEIRVCREELIESSKRYPLPTRMALGRIMTMEEFEIERERILSRPLP